jgi:hypothetical protein
MNRFLGDSDEHSSRVLETVLFLVGAKRAKSKEDQIEPQAKRNVQFNRVDSVLLPWREVC